MIIEAPYDLSFGDGLYMIVTTITTVGFGDYSPRTSTGTVVIACGVVCVCVVYMWWCTYVVCVVYMW